jgi:hypothetical protein
MSRNRPKATPRRKAGSKPSKAKRAIAFRLIVEAQEMRVRYTPNYIGGDLAQGMFEFRSPHKPPRRIAISETGYHCHFAAMDEIRSFESPEAYARAFVLSCLDKGRNKNGVQANQLALF